MFRTVRIGLLLAACVAPASAQTPLTVRLRPDVPVLPEFHASAQGADRALYLGAVDAVLRYDGAQWQRIATPEPGPVRELRTDRHGRLWVGGFDRFGWLRRQADGSDAFVDVVCTGHPGDDAAFGDIWDIVERDDGIYLRALRDLFHVGFDGTPLRHWHHDGRFGAVAELDGRLYAQFRGEGLRVLDGDAFVPVPGSAPHASPLLYNMLPLGDGRALLHDISPRLTWFDGEHFTPFEPAPARERIAHFADGLVLDPQHVAFAGDDGVLRVLDVASGGVRALRLGEAYLTSLRRDRDGALLSSDAEGVIRLDWPPRWTRYASDAGVHGAVHRIAVEGEQLWVLSSAGAARGALVDGLPQPPLLGTDWTAAEAWDLRRDADGLLLAESYGLRSIDRHDGVRTLPPDDLYPRVLVPSADPRRMWAGTEHGIALLQRDGPDWRVHARTVQPGLLLTHVVELAPDRALAAGDPHGLFAVTLTDGGVPSLQLRRIDAADGLRYDARGGAAVSRYGEAIVVSTGAGLFAYDGAQFAGADALRDLAALLGTGEIVALTLADDGTGWAWSHAAVYRRDGRDPRGSWRSALAGGLQTGVIEDLLPLPGGAALAGAGGQLLHYRPAHDDAHADPVGLRVVAATLARGGRRTPLPLDETAMFESGGGTLQLRFGATDYALGPPLQYSTRLIGLDERWSGWNEATRLDIAELPPGDYRFELRARRGNGAPSAGTAYAFGVTPRWHEHAAVRIGCAALLVLLLAWTLNRRHRRRLLRLADANRTLDDLVQQRTLELEEANRRLRDLAAHDGLTGVANRRCFDEHLQQALARASARQRPLCLLLCDVDHFKDYNDRRGHLAGDELLRRIAATLTGRVRDETLVARYGGEEFALVAENCDAAGGRLLGERLRARIAEAMDGVTISVGVACSDAAQREQADAVIARADAALYAAKRGGRNRVEFGEASPAS